MKVQYKSLSMLNLISIKQIVKKEDWLLPAVALRDQVVYNGIYPVGPVLFTYKPLENEPNYGEYMYSVPVNTRVELEKGSPYEYVDDLVIEEAYRLLQKFADEYHIKLETEKHYQQ